MVDRFGDDPVRIDTPRGDGQRAAETLSAALGTESPVETARPPDQ